MPAEGVAALPEGDTAGDADCDGTADSLADAEGEREPPTGLSVGKGALEPSRFAGEAEGAPELEGEVESEGEADGERVTRPDAVPVPRTSCPAVGKGSQEPSKLTGVAVGALGVREAGALPLTIGKVPEGVSLRVPPAGLSVGKGAREPKRLRGEAVPPASKLVDGDAESDFDGCVEREKEVDDVEEREGAGERVLETQRVSVAVSDTERDTAADTESEGFAGTVGKADLEGNRREGVGAPGVGVWVPVRVPPTGLSVGKGSREPTMLPGEPVPTRVAEGAPLVESRAVRVRALEGEATLE